MDAPRVLLVEDVWKRYLLGEIGARTLGEDISRRWAALRGRGDPAAMPERTVASDPSRRSGYLWALESLYMEVREGDVVGIIGRNGAGKSTLLKLLSRITAPTRGRIRARGRIASLLEVGTGFHPDLTGRENVFLNGAIMGMTRREIASRLEEIVEFSGCGAYLDTPTKRYSSGMIVRLGFSVAAHLDCEIMIVDEVLAVGDRQFQERCVAKMRSVSRDEGRTVLFVSHNMSLVRSLCRTGVVIAEGRATCFSSVTDAIAHYAGSTRSPRGSIEYNVDPERPCITRVALDETAMARGDFELAIDFASPRPVSPVPGIVVYDERMTPVFGSNSRIHPAREVLAPARAGRLRCSHPGLPLHGGRYVVSVWLGDAHTDHDAKESAVSFDLPPRTTWIDPAFRAVIGPLDIAPRWTLGRGAGTDEDPYRP